MYFEWPASRNPSSRAVAIEPKTLSNSHGSQKPDAPQRNGSLCVEASGAMITCSTAMASSEVTLILLYIRKRDNQARRRLLTSDMREWLSTIRSARPTTNI
jgi:hypothetical protein